MTQTLTSLLLAGTISLAGFSLSALPDLNQDIELPADEVTYSDHVCSDAPDEVIEHVLKAVAVHAEAIIQGVQGGTLPTTGIPAGAACYVLPEDRELMPGYRARIFVPAVDDGKVYLSLAGATFAI